MQYRRSVLAEVFRAGVISQSKTLNSWEGTHPLFAEMTGDKCFILNQTHLEIAKKELHKFHVVGLQEQFDASLVWAAIELDWNSSELVYDRKVSSGTANPDERTWQCTSFYSFILYFIMCPRVTYWRLFGRFQFVWYVRS